MLSCALFIDALWSHAGKGLTSWLSFVMSNCEVVAFPLVSWVRCNECSIMSIPDICPLSYFLAAVSVLCLFLVLFPWICLQCVSMAFDGYIHLRITFGAWCINRIITMAVILSIVLRSSFDPNRVTHPYVSTHLPRRKICWPIKALQHFLPLVFLCMMTYTCLKTKELYEKVRKHMYSKTCVKRPLKIRQNKDLNDKL